MDAGPDGVDGDAGVSGNPSTVVLGDNQSQNPQSLSGEGTGPEDPSKPRSNCPDGDGVTVVLGGN